jgi:phage gp46-like protein
VTFDSQARQRDIGGGVDVGDIVIRREGGRTTTSGELVIGMGALSSDQSGSTTQFIMTQSNRPARIWVGKTVYDRLRVVEYCRRRGWWREELIERDLGASLWVLPRVGADSTIELEVFPRLTARGTTPLSVDVKELSTRVTVQAGQTVHIGGLSDEQRQVYRYLFGLGTVFNGQSLAISLRAEVVEPSHFNRE